MANGPPGTLTAEPTEWLARSIDSISPALRQVTHAVFPSGVRAMACTPFATVMGLPALSLETEMGTTLLPGDWLDGVSTTQASPSATTTATGPPGTAMAASAWSVDTLIGVTLSESRLV